MRRIAILLAGALCSWEPAAASPSFTGVGDLPGGTFSSGVNTFSGGALSADGLVAAGVSDAGLGSDVGFRWEAGVMAPLIIPGQPGFPDVTNTVPTALSSDGDVLVGYFPNGIPGGYPAGFRYVGDVLVSTPLDPDGQLASTLDDVDADGSVIVGTSAGGSWSFRWLRGATPFSGAAAWLESADTPYFDPMAGPLSTSADGSVVAGSYHDIFDPIPGNVATIWQDGHLTVLGRLPGANSSTSFGISADGSTVVGVSGQVAFRWRAGTLTALSAWPGGVYPSSALDTSADGRITVGRYASPDWSGGALWVGTELHRIEDFLDGAGVDYTGWTNLSPAAISDDGLTISGSGTNPNGDSEGWIARVDGCSNGIDDDGDGSSDFPADPGCKEATSALEQPRCQNGIDDDADGKIDFDGGASLNGGVPVAPVDPPCTAAWKNQEKPKTCGLGAELLLALGVLATWRRRVG